MDASMLRQWVDPPLLPVVAAWEGPQGTFLVLADGRKYQECRGEWVPVMPPLTDDQRMPR